jgi:hypothetical protein
MMGEKTYFFDSFIIPCQSLVADVIFFVGDSRGVGGIYGWYAFLILFLMSLGTFAFAFADVAGGGTAVSGRGVPSGLCRFIFDCSWTQLRTLDSLRSRLLLELVGGSSSSVLGKWFWVLIAMTRGDPHIYQWTFPLL